MLRATVSGVWIALGSILLVCGISCLTGFAVGFGFDDTSILGCGTACTIVGSIMIGSGAVLYYVFRSRETSTL